MRARVTKIFTNHNRLRTDIIEGDVIIEPKVGGQLLMYGEPLNPNASVRSFNTSPIEKIVDNEDNSKTLHTMSGSEYKFEAIDD